jgi:RimJ/RimL family protein N-acetyltransferase
MPGEFESERVMQKTGMQYEGVLREYVYTKES